MMKCTGDAESVSSEIQRRGETARAFFREGYNCAQSVALTFADIIEEEPGRIATALSGFGGGMARRTISPAGPIRLSLMISIAGSLRKRDLLFLSIRQAFRPFGAATVCLP